MMGSARTLLLSAGLFLVALAGCATTNPPAKSASSDANTLAGTLTYRERISLPSGSRVHLTLLDRSRPGSAPIASKDFAAKGEVPIPFSMPIPDVTKDGDWGLYAQIIVAGRSWFTNASEPTRIDPSNPSHTNLEILLRNDMRPLRVVPGM
jgi:uncharacterized lipoprotein YbaY